MTELVFTWLASHCHIERNHVDEGIVAMKGLLLGMMVCMAAGAETLVFIPDGPLTVQQQFIFGLICGTIGTVVGCAMFDTPNLKALARQATTNLGLASLLAPTIAGCFTKITQIPTTIQVLAPIAGLLGIGGSVIFAKVWPAIVEASAKRAKRRIRDFMGDDSNG